MATQQEVLKFFEAKYNFELIDDNFLKILFEVDNGRSQVVFVSIRELFMTISSPFGDESNLNANLALKLAEESLFGVKKFGELFALQHVLLIADLDESEIVNGLDLVASTADDLEKSVGGDVY